MAVQPAAKAELDLGKEPEHADYETSKLTPSFPSTQEDFLNPQHALYGSVDEFGRPLPGWLDCLTFRPAIDEFRQIQPEKGSFALLKPGLLYAGQSYWLLVLKLGFTVGVIPSLNIAASLLGYAGIKAFVSAANFCHLRLLSKPFTRQENTVIQTTVVAVYGLAFSGGFTQSLLGMTWNAYLSSEGGPIQFPNENVPETVYGHPPAVLPPNVIQPNLGKYIGFMALINFMGNNIDFNSGVLVLVPLRRLYIIKYRLTYPSGTATGTIINGFHLPMGEEQAKKQVKQLFGWFSLSFFYSFAKWIFSGPQASCGLDYLPSFGMKARYWTWYTDLSQTYIGIGLLVPKHISYGIMCGAVLTYGIMWPLINTYRAGIWFPEQYKQPSKNIQGLYGYKVFIGIGFLLGDGAYMMVKLLIVSIWTAIKSARTSHSVADDNVPAEQMTANQRQERKLRDLRDFVFLNGQFPEWIAYIIYGALVIIALGVIPQMFAGVKAYQVLVAYILGPILCFTNAYGMGLSDWNLLKIYGQLGIIIFAAWGGNVIAGLALATCIQTLTGACADLMQDFKTGWLTLSNPRSMFVAQVTGSALAVIISPATFWLYWSRYNIGNPDGEYKAPFAAVWRNIAVVAINGSKDLPKHCLGLAGGAFGFAIVLSLIREYLSHKFGSESVWVKLVPIPSMLGIPSFVGAFFTVDMAIGSVILAIWQYLAPATALQLAPVVASALIAGDSVWQVPNAILALAKVNPPLCAQFFRTNYFDDKISSLLESQ